jgi:hypothetical protein
VKFDLKMYLREKDKLLLFLLIKCGINLQFTKLFATKMKILLYNIRSFRTIICYQSDVDSKEFKFVGTILSLSWYCMR